MPLKGVVPLIAVLGSMAEPAQAACMVSTQNVAFGLYSTTSAATTDSVGGVTVTCSGLIQVLVSYTILIGGGTWGSVDDRKMASGGGRLRYQLYAEPTRQVVWGDNTHGTQPVQRQTLLALLNSGATHPIYGRIFAFQNVPPGNYTDALQILVIY